MNIHKLRKNLNENYPYLDKIINKLLEVRRYLRYQYLQSLDSKKYPEVIAREYKTIMGKKLDWSQLNTYNEKMQWAKLYDRDPLKTILSDKYLARKKIESKIGSEYLIPIYGAWKDFDSVDFSLLPKSFVLKTNHGSGTNLVVKDKDTLNYREAKRKFDKWMNLNFAYYNGLEPHYNDIKPMIIAEEYIEDSNGELNDYKFLCFHGNVYYCWVDIDRLGNHRRNVYNLEWELQPWNQFYYNNADSSIPKPKNFEKMIEIAKVLSKGFSHVRVDLYNVDGKIYFGELTFTNGRGYEEIVPHKYNLKLGNLWILEE